MGKKKKQEQKKIKSNQHKEIAINALIDLIVGIILIIIDKLLS